MEARLRDVRFAGKSLGRQPMFTVVAVLTVAIGVGATTTIFSVANGLLLRVPAGVRDQERLVSVHRLSQDGSSFHSFGIPLYRAMASSGDDPVQLGAFDTFVGGLVVDDTSFRFQGSLVPANYLQMVGVRPALGRFFHSEEDTVPGRDLVVVISHRLWQERFGGEPDVIGRQIQLNGSGFTVIGVTEPGFEGHVVIFVMDLWVPISAQGVVFARPDLSDESARTSVKAVGRLAPGASVEQARAALDAVAFSFLEDREQEWHGVDVYPYSPLFQALRTPVVAFLAALFVVAGVLLAITSVNVASMMLSRGAARGREVGIRLAMGATRGRVVAQLLTESIVLFMLGGGLGVLMAFWATGLLAGFGLPIPIDLDLSFRPDMRVLGFALAVSTLTGAIFGLSPALHATRGDLVSALKEGWSQPRGRQRLRGALVVAQVAGCAVLLVAAGLLLRSLARAGSVDLGLDPSGVLAVMVDTGSAERTTEESRQFFTRLLEEARQTAGVNSVGLIDVPPLTGSNQQSIAVLPDRPAVRGDGLRRIEYARITPGYLETMRISLLSGRDFDSRDVDGSPGVAIVNATFANQAFGRTDVIGQHFGLGSSTEPLDVEIVAVTQDSKIRSAGDQPRSLVYVPWAKSGDRNMTMVLRSRDLALASVLRAKIHQMDAALPPPMLLPYSELVGLGLLPGKLAAALATGFGAIGLLLAAVGLYGVLACSVVQRTREIGIRMALGAEHRQVQRLVIREGLRLTGIGLVVGLVLAVGMGMLLRVVLFGISPVDPLTYGAIGVVLLVVAASACWLPARRAATTDPVVALRME